MQIVAAELIDLPGIIEILSETTGTLWSGESISKQKLMEYILVQKHLCFVVKEQDIVIGVSFITSLGRVSRHLEGVMQCEFAVHRSHQGKGIGTALVQHAVEFCKRNMAHKIILYVTANNLRAIHIYLKAGFKFESVDRQGYDGQDQYIMSILEG